MMKPFQIVLAAALAALLAPHASAEPPAPGLERLAACRACHGMDGVSVYGPAPNLAGQRANYLESQLRAFRAKERTDDLMNAIAGQLQDNEVHALAQHWSSLPAAGTLDDTARRAGAIRSAVTFPQNFPNGFEIYRTDEDAAGGTIVRDWANRPALDAARVGRALPDNAVIVGETMAARTENGRLVPDHAVSYAVFAAKAGWGESVPELLRNGNWQFGLFRPDHTATLANQAMCLACHKPRAATSFMFTYDALAAHAGR